MGFIYGSRRRDAHPKSAGMRRYFRFRPRAPFCFFFASFLLLFFEGSVEGGGFSFTSDIENNSLR